MAAEEDKEPGVQLLSSVGVVCRGIPSLLRVARRIDDFLDASQRISFARACRIPSLRLVKRILARDGCEPAASLRRDPMYRQWQFSTGMPEAVAAGDFELVRWLAGYFQGCQLSARAVSEAASHGRLGILQWLQKQGWALSPSSRDVEKAFRANKPGTALWLHHRRLESGKVPTVRAMRSWCAAAARHGNLSAVQWCRAEIHRFEGFDEEVVYSSAREDKTAKRRPTALDLAAEGGHVAVIEWLLNGGDDIDTFFTGYRSDPRVGLNYAAAGGQLLLMKWLYAHYRANCNVDDAFLVAAKTGRLEIVRWLHDNVHYLGPCVVQAMGEAARNGHLDVVKWLLANRSEGCTSRVMDLAASGGSLEVVQWLDQNTDEEFTTSGIDGAARGGHLAMVQWLHQRGEKCTTAAMDRAAEHNHMAVVEWLHAFRLEGCTFRAMDNAARNGHLSMVQWLHVNRSEGCTTNAMDRAASNGHLEIVQWLHINRHEGCTTKAMDGAAKGGYLEVVQWLHWNRNEGCTDANAMDNAAAHGHFHVVLFLHHQRTEGCSVLGLARMQSNGHGEFLSWFKGHYPLEFRLCCPSV